jgi:hypothetical protein
VIISFPAAPRREVDGSTEVFCAVMNFGNVRREFSLSVRTFCADAGPLNARKPIQAINIVNIRMDWCIPEYSLNKKTSPQKVPWTG